MAGSHEKSNLRVSAEKVLRFPGEVGVMMWEMGKEDPRRVIHSIKVGLALSLASMLCLLESLSQGIGQNAIWAVMTVVVVLEFTAGNFNLSKNRKGYKESKKEMIVADMGIHNFCEHV